MRGKNCACTRETCWLRSAWTSIKCKVKRSTGEKPYKKERSIFLVDYIPYYGFCGFFLLYLPVSWLCVLLILSLSQRTWKKGTKKSSASFTSNLSTWLTANAMMELLFLRSRLDVMLGQSIKIIIISGSLLQIPHLCCFFFWFFYERQFEYNRKKVQVLWLNYAVWDFSPFFRLSEAGIKFPSGFSGSNQ